MSYPATTLPQTTYNKSFAPGMLGQLYRAGENTHEKGALPALETIQPGDLLERLFDNTSGAYVVRVAQSASGSLQSLAGVAIYKSMRQPVAPPYQSAPSGYVAGEMVPYVRRGKIYAKWLSTDGSTAQVPYTAPKYAHSSTTAGFTRGAFTDKATSSTAGSEVDNCPSGVVLCEDQTSWAGFTNNSGTYTSICLVELNLP